MFNPICVKIDINNLLNKLIISFLIASFFLIIIMAISSGYNEHPDEYLHLAATQYYYNHWLPPPVGDQNTLNSYSKYGFSYLNNLEIVYFFIGKFSKVINSIFCKFISDRLFYVFLYFILTCYCAYNYSSRITFIIFLISPQVWYIFSYLNGDAFPFFLSFIIINELIIENSMYNKYLESCNNLRFRWPVFFLGIMFGLLFLSKSNYLILIFYLIFILVWKIFNSPGSIKRKALLNSVLIIVIGFSLFFIAYIHDLAINGFDKSNKIVYYAEKLADPQFKPYTASYSNKSYYGLLLKAKGITYSELFSLWNWHKITFMSLVGTYGWMNIYTSPLYYNLMGYTYIIFFTYIFLSILYQSTSKNQIFLIITLCFILATIFLSTIFSWVVDFQAQGRYLFPIFIMLCPIFYYNRSILNNYILFFFILLFFSLSSYSFINICLIYI